MTRCSSATPPARISPTEAAAGARDLYHSLQRLLELHDGVEVYPGHVSGSLCGAGMSSKASSTIGFERRFNHRLRAGDEDEFVTEAIKTGVRPPNMDAIVELNRGPFLRGPDQLEQLEDGGGGTMLDVRPAEEFAAGHAKGALNVALGAGSFATKAAFVLPAGERVVIHASSAGQAEEAAAGLRSVGIFDLAGYRLCPPSDEQLASIELDELHRLVESDEVDVIDVREPHERDEGYIPGSRNIPYRLVREWADDLQNGKPVVTICSSGPRPACIGAVRENRIINPTRTEMPFFITYLLD